MNLLYSIARDRFFAKICKSRRLHIFRRNMSIHISRASLYIFLIPCWVDGLEVKRIPIHRPLIFQNAFFLKRKKKKKRNKENIVYFRNLFLFYGAGQQVWNFKLQIPILKKICNWYPRAGQPQLLKIFVGMFPDFWIFCVEIL